MEATASGGTGSYARMMLSYPDPRLAALKAQDGRVTTRKLLLLAPTLAGMALARTRSTAAKHGEAAYPPTRY